MKHIFISFLFFILYQTAYCMEGEQLQKSTSNEKLPREMQHEILKQLNPLPSSIEDEEEAHRYYYGLGVGPKKYEHVAQHSGDFDDHSKPNQPSENFAPFLTNIFECGSYHFNNFTLYDFIHKHQFPMKKAHVMFHGKFLIDGPNDNNMFVTARNDEFSHTPHFAVGKITHSINHNELFYSDPEYCEYESMFGKRKNVWTHLDKYKTPNALALHKSINRFALANTKNNYKKDFDPTPSSIQHEIIVYDYQDRFAYSGIPSGCTNHPRLPVVGRIEYEDDITFKRISFLTEKTLLGLSTQGTVYIIAIDEVERDKDFNNDEQDINTNIRLLKQTFKYNNKEEASIDEMAVDPCYPFHVLLYTNGRVKYWNLKSGKIMTISDETKHAHNMRFYDNTIYFYTTTFNHTQVVTYEVTPGSISKLYDYYNYSPPKKENSHSKMQTLSIAGGSAGGLILGYQLAKKYDLLNSHLKYPLIIASTLVGTYLVSSNLLQKLAKSQITAIAAGGLGGLKLGYYLVKKLNLEDSNLKYPVILSSTFLGAYCCLDFQKTIRNPWITKYYNL